jgi:hypothetical protein
MGWLCLRLASARRRAQRANQLRRARRRCMYAGMPGASDRIQARVRRAGLVQIAIAALLAIACHGSKVPASSSGSGAAAPVNPTGTSVASTAPPASIAPSASAPAEASVIAEPPRPPVAVAEPRAQPVELEALAAADGKALPQTDARPSTASPHFQRRIADVARAIKTGDAELAREAFFPLVAYRQVKDIAKPERDYKFRLLANFARDVKEYHQALGGDAERTEFVGIDVPEDQVRWLGPGSEGNKIGYFRVLRAHLRFRLSTGSERSLELTSLISWRGEWYVVHLHGFK